MKKLIFLMTFGLLVCAAGYTAEYKMHNCAISFSRVTSNFSQNVLSGVKRFSTNNDSDNSSKLNDLYHKYRITKKGSINFIIAGGVCSGLGTLFLGNDAIQRHPRLYESRRALCLCRNTVFLRICRLSISYSIRKCRYIYGNYRSIDGTVLSATSDIRLSCSL